MNTIILTDAATHATIGSITGTTPADVHAALTDDPGLRGYTLAHLTHAAPHPVATLTH